MFCTKCGASNDDSSKFCIKCGQELTQNTENGNNNQAEGFNSFRPESQPQPQVQPNNYQQFPPPPPPQQPYDGYQQPPVNNGSYKVPITGRNIAICIILTFVTCGIYGIYWFIKLVDDLNVAAQTPEDTNGITVFLLGLVTCGIFYFYWYYKAGDKVNRVKKFCGYPSGDSEILYLLLGIFGLGIVNYVLIQTELNKVAITQA